MAERISKQMFFYRFFGYPFINRRGRRFLIKTGQARVPARAEHVQFAGGGQI